MNTFTTALAGLCAARPLDEKRLVAPSRRVGNQWLDAVARAGQPVLNARVETLRSLAGELTANRTVVCNHSANGYGPFGVVS